MKIIHAMNDITGSPNRQFLGGGYSLASEKRGFVRETFGAVAAI